MNRTTTKRPETHCTGQDCRTFFTRNPGDGGVVRSTVAPTLCVRCAPLYPVRPMLSTAGGAK